MGIALSLLVLLLVLLVSAPSVGGYETFVVLSGSMEPALAVGDLAIVAPVPSDQLQVGDIITYRTPQQPDRLVTHRIVAISADSQGRPVFQTKGDANNTLDQVAVGQSGVLGRVAWVIPRLGYVVAFGWRPEGKLVLFGVPALLLIVDSVFAARKKAKATPPPAASATDVTAIDLAAAGRTALEHHETAAARALFDQAIAADPRLVDAWLGKAEALPPGPERVDCLRAALTVNPGAAPLQHALDRALAAEPASG